MLAATSVCAARGALQHDDVVMLRLPQRFYCAAVGVIHVHSCLWSCALAKVWAAASAVYCWRRRMPWLGGCCSCLLARLWSKFCKFRYTLDSCMGFCTHAWALQILLLRLSAAAVENHLCVVHVACGNDHGVMAVYVNSPISMMSITAK